MLCQVHAIGKVVRPLLADLVIYVSGFMKTFPNCTLEVTRYSILKILKQYNQPKIEHAKKLTQKVDYFTAFENFPSTECWSQNLLYKKLEKFGWLDVSGSIRDVYIGWVAGMDWQEKVMVQNGGMALVKPNNQPGGVVLAP